MHANSDATTLETLEQEQPLEMVAVGQTVVIALLHCAQLISCSRILGVFPVPSISHQIVYRALTTELARRGHHVTVITTDPVKDHGAPQANNRQIDVHDISYRIWKEIFNFVRLRGTTGSPKDVYPLFVKATLKIIDAQLETAEVKAIVQNSTEHFDLLILESLVASNFGFAWRFKVPYIGISSLSGLISNFDAVGNPSHPVLYPDIFREKLGTLNVWDKIKVIYSDLCIRYADYSFRDEVNAVSRKHFGEDTPPVDKLADDMDMLFLNIHPLLAGIRPMVPAVVCLGGMHLKPKKKLPKDLQTFLDDSPQGVVYMSLGSNVMSKDLPPQTLQMILEVFRELPYRVLWKFEEDLPNKPSNVKISKWLPQQDLLGHKNIKVFITQGGQQSMEEAIRDHVPLIGIPFMADQDLNVQNFVQRGIGVGLNINTLTKEEFKTTIMTITKEAKYKKNIKQLSELLADQPMSGLERAVWWSEYVLRHGGARHLRAPTADVSFAEYFLLDVAGMLAALAATLALSVALLGRLFHKTLCASGVKIKTN